MTSANGLPTITTYSGKTFNYVTPDPVSICIEDIAHALSLECRFANQSKVHYSVAQHSILVSEMVPDGEMLRKVALLHDATEAYMVDLPRPLKRLLPGYQEIEARVYKAIATKFKILDFIPKVVKDADNQLLANEGISFMGSDWRDAAVEPSEKIGVIEAWSAEKSEIRFLKRFEELFGR